MSDAGFVAMPPVAPENSRKVSIVGVGETDYHRDYRAERERPEGWKPSSDRGDVQDRVRPRRSRLLGSIPSEIDGLAMHYTFGGTGCSRNGEAT